MGASLTQGHDQFSSGCGFMGVFTQRNFVAEFIRFKLLFFTNMTNLLFEQPFGGLRANVRTSSIARWKARGRLPIHDN